MIGRNLYVKVLCVWVVLLWSGITTAEDLVAIYDVAVSKDPYLAITQSAHRDVQLEQPLATSRFLPSFNIRGSYSENHADTTTSNIDTGENYTSSSFSLVLSQPLYYQDAFVQSSLADKLVLKSEIELKAGEQDLIIRVAERYFEVLAAKDNLEFAKSEKEAIDRQLEQTKQRFNVGLIAITDVHESQARYDLSAAQEIDAENRLANAYEAMREVTGQMHTAVSTLAKNSPLVTPQPARIEHWVETSLKQNLNLLIATWNVDIARMQIKRQRSARYPTLDLVGSFTGSDDTDRTGGSDSHLASVALQLNWQLYSGGLVGTFVDRAIEQTNQATEAQEAARRATVRQTRDAYLGVLAGISRVKALNQAVVSNRSALKATEAGYEVGTRTTVDVLNARTNLFLAQQNYTQARYDYIMLILKLKQAVGVLSRSDLEQVNRWLKS